MKILSSLAGGVGGSMLLSTVLPLFLLPSLASSKAIMGVDLGSLYMKVALVQRNSPLEIVTNLHSKRKTEQMVLFDQGARFYGADAFSLLGRKPQLTPSAMSLMLGRDAEHPSVQVLAERHFPLTPSYNETRYGVYLTVDGVEFTPEELVAMVLTHARDITATYGEKELSMVRDCVLTVPSFYTQHERLALLDAATLADLNVLALIDENTAAALHFGIDRIDKEPYNVIFYNMGASALQVSAVTFTSYEHKESKYSKAKTVGAFEVKGKGWDTTLGGQAFDARLVDFMADAFNKQLEEKYKDGKERNVRSNARAMAKLRLQANKVKHVLSANKDIPVYIDSLFEDTNFQMHITRAEFEEICHDLLVRSVKPIENALKAANMTLEDIHAVELIGGGMRVPKVQEEIRHILGDKVDLGMHINSDESMALGASFHGANVSTAFKVRQVGLSDVNPFPIAVSLETLEAAKNGLGLGSLFGIGKKKKEELAGEGEGEDGASEEWQKRATLFKSFGRVGVKKTIAFTQSKDVHCSLDYEESSLLPSGTERAIIRYNITGVEKFAEEMSEKGLGTPKVSLQFELSSSGISQLVKAEAAAEEIVMVKEEVEVDDEEEEEASGETKEEETKEEADEKNDSEETAKEEENDKTEDKPAEDKESKAEEPGDADKTEEADKPEESTAEKSEEEASKADDKEASAEDEKNKTKEEKKAEKKKKKKKKTKMVEKEQKKVHKRSLDVKVYYVGKTQPYSTVVMEESKAKLDDLAAKDKARMLLEETKNKFESYIYKVKNKLVDEEEAIGKVTTEEQREELKKLAEEAGDWLDFDGWDADQATFEEKYKELSTPAEEIFFRMTEMGLRPKIVTALREKLDQVKELMTKWETTKPQVTEEERADVLKKVEDVETWLGEQEEAQKATNPWEKPAFTSAEVPKKFIPVEKIVSRLSKKPKPKPPKKEKNETADASKQNATEEEATEGKETKEDADEGGKAEDPAKEGKDNEDASDKATDAEEEKTEETKTDETNEEL